VRSGRSYLESAAPQGAVTAHHVRSPLVPGAAVPGSNNLVPSVSQRLAKLKATEDCGRRVALAPVGLIEPSEEEAETMAFNRQQIRDSIERAGDQHWQALVRHHTDAYPESNPTPGDVARAEAERLNALGLGNNPNLKLVESRVEQVPPAVRITHVFEDRDKGTRFETEPFTGYE
jgi:hypothetical protein